MLALDDTPACGTPSRAATVVIKETIEATGECSMIKVEWDMQK